MIKKIFLYILFLFFTFIIINYKIFLAYFYNEFWIYFYNNGLINKSLYFYEKSLSFSYSLEARNNYNYVLNLINKKKGILNFSNSSDDNNQNEAKNWFNNKKSNLIDNSNYSKYKLDINKKLDIIDSLEIEKIEDYIYDLKNEKRYEKPNSNLDDLFRKINK
jgi:hypothetical protein